MSDQADNLRQLVRAQREWRELTLEDPPAPVARQSRPVGHVALAECRRTRTGVGDRCRAVVDCHGPGRRWVFGRSAR